MVLSLLLVIGALGWAISEAMALAAGGIGIADGWTGTIALFVVAAGIFTLRTEPGMAREGRVGIAMISFGAMCFAMVLIITLTSGVLGSIANGEITYGAMVWTPFYLLSLAFLISGLGALGLHYRRQSGGLVIAIALGALAIAHLCRVFAIESFWLHRGAGIATALVLCALGVKKLMQR